MTILAQHAIQGRLTNSDTALARWMVFVHTHCDLPLDYNVFPSLLQTLHNGFVTESLALEEEIKYLETAVLFTHHALEFIRRHRHFIGNNDNNLGQLKAIFSSLKLVANSAEGYKMDENVNCDDYERIVSLTTHGFMVKEIREATVEGIEQWFNYLRTSLNEGIESHSAVSLENATNLLHLLLKDLRHGINDIAETFSETFGFDYGKMTLQVYLKEVQLRNTH